MKLNTFNEVVNWFDKTLPLRGQRASQVIRPIGQRNRAWERIEKVNENCYILTDGWGAWGTSGLTPAERNAIDGKYVAYAPIMWERREDGDYVRVRNCPQNCGSPSRFNFVRWNLPRGMDFRWGDAEHKSGKHYIIANTGNGHEKFFLPKFTIKQGAGTNEVENDGGQMLWFKHVGEATWERVGEVMGEPVKRLNKSLSQQYKQAINEFYEFMGATIPALGYMDHDARVTYWQMLNGGSDNNYYWGRTLRNLNNPEMVREVLMQFDHPKRVALAVHVANDLGIYARAGEYKMNAETGKNEWFNHEYMDMPETVDEAKVLRRKYIAVIRKAADMFETVYK